MKRYPMKNTSLKCFSVGLVSAIAISAASASSPALAQDVSVKDLNIVTQPLDAAVNQVAEQAGVQIVLYSEEANGITAPALSGTFTVEQALQRILNGTGLQYRWVNTGTIAVATPARLSFNETETVAVRPVPVADDPRPLASPNVQPAQERPEDAVMREDVIIVTARKKEEGLLDVPGTVTVLTSEQLRANGTTDAQSLALNNLGLVYSVTFAGTSAPRVTIRGVGDDDFNPNGSSSAAVHVNGIYQGTNGLLNGQYFDIRQVEILKGPQGTIYGRNATAGAINISTKRPGNAYGGYGDLEIGNYGTVRGEGAVDLPVSDFVRLRFAGLFERSDGFYEHLGTGPLSGFSYRPGVIPGQAEVPAQGDWGGSDRNFGRLTAEMDLGPGTLLTLRSTFGIDRSELPLSDVTPELWEGYESRAFFINPADPAFEAYEAALDNDPFTVYANVLPQLEAEQFGVNAELDHDFDNGLKATLILGYEALDRVYSTTDNVPVEAADYDWDNDFSQITAEARLSNDRRDGFGWILGAFLLDDEIDFGTTLRFRNTGLWQSDIQTDYNQGRTSFGLFASTDWTPTEWFTLETGLRYSSDEVTFRGQTTNLDPFGTFGPAPTFFPLGSVFIGAPIDPAQPLVFDEDLSNEDVTWKVSGILRPVDTVSLYATISTGYKAGGFDGSTILSPQEALPIEPESVIAYEAGAKYQSSNGLLFGDASVFYYDFEDYQSTALLNVGGFNTNVRANVADATIQGAEFSATLQPIDWLNLRAGVALLETEIVNFQGVQEGVEGNELPFSPDISWNAAAIYSVALSPRFSLSGQIDVSSTGSNFQTINNNDEVEEYVVANARLALETDNWELGVWARNLSDETYDIGFFPGGALTPDNKFKGAPQTYGVNLRVRF
jgi:iron complex outermembrane recepter protein